MKAWGIKVRPHGGFGEWIIGHDCPYIETKVFEAIAVAITSLLFQKNKHSLSNQEYDKLRDVLIRCHFDKPAIGKVLTIAKKVISGKRKSNFSHLSSLNKKEVATRFTKFIKENGDYSSEILSSFEEICHKIGVRKGLKDRLIRDLASEIPKTFDEIIADLNSMIGLNEVKTDLKTLYNSITLQKERDAQGLKSPKPNLHYIFTGKPGTGKTSVARILGNIYRTLR